MCRLPDCDNQAAKCTDEQGDELDDEMEDELNDDDYEY